MGHPRWSLAAASRVGQAGSMLIWFTLFVTTFVFVLVFLRFLFLGVAVSGPVFEAVAAAGDGDYLGVMEESVQDRRGRGDIAEQLSPVFQRSV